MDTSRDSPISTSSQNFGIPLSTQATTRYTGGEWGRGGRSHQVSAEQQNKLNQLGRFMWLKTVLSQTVLESLYLDVVNTESRTIDHTSQIKGLYTHIYIYII